MTKPILIIGATSGIGRCAMNEAVRRGLPVRAFARSADKLEAADLVEPFKGDATSAEDVLRALDGARAVVYALGITERLAMLWEEETLFSETTPFCFMQWRSRMCHVWWSLPGSARAAAKAR
ncbi:NAD(P)H-binding protein [Marivita sp.]|uniref:NAD(P)H-binding protein n=1 Tax=Marivita sp. TaxID=2003365 RepID=UPI0025C45AE2|nr:NAD(P)H-binding protein [Marivita sp.]